MEILVQKVMINQEVQIHFVTNVLIHFIEIKEIVDLVIRHVILIIFLIE